MNKRFSIQCTLSPSCSKLPDFQSIQDYEHHYSKYHTHVCGTCRRILPTAQLLHLHLLELHDSFFATYSQQRNAYECFVEGCPKKCRTLETRKRHLIDKHKFPKRFDFRAVEGEERPSVGSRKEKTQRAIQKTLKKASLDTQTPSSQDANPIRSQKSTESDPPEMQMTDLVASLSKLSIPRSVQLARQRKEKDSRKDDMSVS